VVAAARVEGRSTDRAAIAGAQIFEHSHLSAAASAQDGFAMPLVSGPDFSRVVGKRSVAINTSIVGLAASHLDSDYVCRPVVVRAPGVGVEVDSTDGILRSGIDHR
jgi:hypothetical protein